MDQLAQKFVEFVDTPWAPVLLFIHAFMEASFLPGAHDFFLVAVDVVKPNLCFFFAAFSTVGSTCGGCFGYGLGRYGGRPLIEKIIHRDIADHIEKTYQKYGMWAVAFAGFTPVPYKIFAVCSGIFRINFLKFAIVSFFARGARFFTVSSLIYFIGPHIKDYIVESFNVFSIIILSFIAVTFFWLRSIKKKVKHE